MATLYYNQPGFIDRHGVAADALDKQMDALRMRYNKLPLQCGRFFRVVEARGGAYRESNYGTQLPLPPVSEDSAKMPTASPVPGYREDITIETCRLSVQVERALVEDQLFSVATNMMSGLLESGRRLLEYCMAAKLNNLTSTATAYVGADAVAVAASNHPQERRETGTWSNLDTGAVLSHASFSTNRVNLRGRTSEFGYVSGLLPKLLVVPSALEKVARQIKTSELNPDNNLNAINPWAKDAWEVFVCDYLTSSTVWFTMGDMPEQHRGFLLAQVVPPSVAPLEGKDKSTDIIWGQRLRMRFGLGVLTERNLQYNAGS